MLTYYMLVKCAASIDDLHIHPDRMLRNIDVLFGLVFSQPVLLGLLAAVAVPATTCTASCNAT